MQETASLVTETEIINQLSCIVFEDELEDRSEKLVELLSSSSTAKVAIEPILRFMENHDTWDYGSPGPFVHFIESYYGNGYEQLLIDSIKRKPTLHTLWMLNRIINGEKKPERKSFYLKAMSESANNKFVDQATQERAIHFLSLHSD
ncbi:MAG: hypothetical protein NTX45_16035 [Proteobacteria bacterium]|nr:hypothetical protein [Pseudomonadota bacterium]